MLQNPRSPLRFWHEAPPAWLAFCLMLALRLYAVWHMPVDSDEPQRQRPTWLVFEGITRYRIRRGLLPDDTVAQIVAHGTPMAIAANLMPADAWFVNRHYLSIGQRLRLLGQRLPAGSQMTVDVAVPADYAVVRADGHRLWLRVDGGPARQRFHLGVGPHRLEIVGEAGGVSALVWADALDRGLAPQRLFHPAPLAMTDAAPGRPASR